MSARATIFRSETINDWALRDTLVDHAERLIRIAENLGRMAERGQDRLALAAALDARFTAGQAVELARELVGREQ